jgi:hypothetical protein
VVRDLPHRVEGGFELSLLLRVVGVEFLGGPGLLLERLQDGLPGGMGPPRPQGTPAAARILSGSNNTRRA